jgi:hypothetical protein
MVGVLPLAIALGVLAIRSGSVVPSIVAHALNNVIALLMFHDTLPGVSRALTASPTMTLVAAIVVYAGGVALAATGAA